MATRAKPIADFERFTYEATINCDRCPAYTAPYGHGGRRAGPSYSRGEVVEILMLEDCGTYVSALLADDTWINVWCLHNKQGEPVGVDLCTLNAKAEHSVRSEMR